MRDEEAVPENQRGFVSAAELAKLSLESAAPGSEHARQLVRRVRRAMVKAKMGDLIETRRYVGFRLRVFPLLTAD
jgi:DNA-binding response OmpR family regulator